MEDVTMTDLQQRIETIIDEVEKVRSKKLHALAADLAVSYVVVRRAYKVVRMLQKRRKV